MKKHIALLLPALTAAVLLTSCHDKSGHKFEATGAAYEVLVVSPKTVWDGPVGDTLRAVLLEPVYMINQKEPLVDLFQVAPQGFTGLLERQRNIIDVQIGQDFPQPAMTVAYDVSAKPQMVVNITGPDTKTVAAFVYERKAELQKVFEIAERDRFLAHTTKYTERGVNELISKKFGFEIKMPRGYTVRSDKPDFLWLSYELPLVSQGMVIYSYPYTGKSDFELDSLLGKRNRFVALVPGPADGSYMSTSDAMEPDVRHVRIRGRFWAEMRGFWDVKGDFMGGPFVSYSTLDVANNRVVCLDAYLFSPKNNKRNYLRELESLVYTVRFPGDQEIADGRDSAAAN